MLSATLRRIRHSARRLVLTSFAVALGVTFLVGALVLDDSTRSALQRSSELAYAGGDVVVRAPGGFEAGPAHPLPPIPAGLEGRVDDLTGVVSVEARYRARAQVLSGGRADGSAVATSLPSDPDAAAIERRTGRLPAAPGEVAVDADLARRLELRLGDRIGVLLADGPVQLQVVGTVGFGGLDGLAGGGRLLLDRAWAADLLGDGVPHELTVSGGDLLPAQLRELLATSLGDDLAVRTAAEAAAADAASAGAATAAVGSVLVGVAALALLVGGFLIANTLRILVTQRIRELALLRAIGASRRQIVGTLLLEAGLVGLAGAMIGGAAGVAVGAALVPASGGLLPGMPPTSAVITPRALTIGIGVGVTVALLASHGAIRQAVAVAPVAAMRAADLEDRPARPLRLVAGVLATTAGVGLTVVGAGARPLVVAGGAVLVIVGAGTLFPFATGPLLRLVNRPMEWFGTTALLARQQSSAAPRRTGATASALAVSLALVTFLFTVGASFGAASPTVVSDRQHAEIVIRSDAPWGLQSYLTRLGAEVRELPEVAHAETVAYGEFAVAASEAEPYRDASYHAADPTVIGDLVDIRPAAGELAAVRDGEVAVRERVADINGWRLGEEVAIRFPDGHETSLRLVATFDGQVTTDWLLHPETAEPHLAAAGREIFVKLVDGSAVQAARGPIETIATDYPETRVLDRAAQEAQVADANQSTFGILAALLSLSVLIGVLGVLNTLNLAVVERTRELGLLRAVGATRGQIRALIRWEALLLSTLGAVLGAGFGVGLAGIATRAFTEFTLPFVVPAAEVGGAVAATVLLGVAASVLPARRAARIPLLTALEQT